MKPLLPNSAWLRKNSYGGLDAAMRVRPELFAHIPQERRVTKSPEEQLQLVMQLTENGKKPIPGVGWLIGNGYGGLDGWLSRHPEVVEKYGRDWAGGRTSEEQLQLVMQLTENGKKPIPGVGWLIDNGYSGLNSWLLKNPEVVEKYGRDWAGGRTPEEQLQLVMQLTENGKKPIPHRQWLQGNGYSGLDSWLRKRPEVVEKYGQDWAGGRTSEEQLQLVMQLTENGKKPIPGVGWLCGNGYRGLDDWLRKHPEVVEKYGRDRLRAGGRVAA